MPSWYLTDQAAEDQVISELKEKLHLQEALWAQEKAFADKLSVQTKEQDAVHQCIWALEAKVDSLMAHHTIQSEQRELDATSSTQMMSALKSKYSTLSVLLYKSVPSDISTGWMLFSQVEISSRPRCFRKRILSSS